MNMEYQKMCIADHEIQGNDVLDKDNKINT